ncbi:hypothetical protein IWX90DRAFT_188847 [Phyllosticta citrichinensis]|uniref:Uncharacterized protein n=1 Tax=Phyllosticta citrichinensis TaxID=1130410 RepID=A0ABR1XWZ6_9PEZI
MSLVPVKVCFSAATSALGRQTATQAAASPALRIVASWRQTVATCLTNFVGLQLPTPSSIGLSGVSRRATNGPPCAARRHRRWKNTDGGESYVLGDGIPIAALDQYKALGLMSQARSQPTTKFMTDDGTDPPFENWRTCSGPRALGPRQCPLAHFSRGKMSGSVKRNWRQQELIFDEAESQLISHHYLETTGQNRTTDPGWLVSYPTDLPP